MSVSPRAAMGAGLAATLLGVGLQRFAYAPLLPAMVGAQWLGAGAAGQLGAANFAGYLAGGLAAPAVARRLGLRPALRGAMLLAALCFALCAVRGPLAWFLPWRTLAGIAGGVLMVLAGPAVQAAVPPEQRARAAGVTFVGPGAGIVIASAVVPALLPVGLPAAWLALAGMGALLTAWSWRRWPAAIPAAAGAGVRLDADAVRLIAAYALSAVAATAHMAWWPDFIARGLGLGTRTGALFWALYGLAAVAATLGVGSAIARLGTARVLFATIALQALGAGVAVAAHGWPLLLLSTLVSGASAIAMTALALTRARELAGAGGPALWRICTIAWGAAQTAAGFALAGLYARTGMHAPLFAASAVAALLALPLAWPRRT